MTASASPSLRCQKSPSAPRPSFKAAAIVVLDTFALAPKSQSIGRLSKAVLARHQVSATTATVESLTFTAPLTPRIALIFDSSKLTNLPPNTGQLLTAAHNIPGRRKSIANTLAPLTLSAVSKRGTAVPAIFQSWGFFKTIDLDSGGVNLAAASATLP